MIGHALSAGLPDHHERHVRTAAADDEPTVRSIRALRQARSGYSDGTNACRHTASPNVNDLLRHTFGHGYGSNVARLSRCDHRA